MTARTTMDALIANLRGKTEAGTADYALAGVAYWSDDQLQTELDKTRQLVNYNAMDAIPTYGIGGTLTYTLYRTYKQDWEKLPTIQDEGGTTLGTALYTFDDELGEVTFGSDTEGKTRYITGYVYNVDLAAANVWRKKAAHFAASFDFSTDNHRVNKGQLIDHCFKMAEMYDSFSGFGNGSIDLTRADDVC